MLNLSPMELARQAATRNSGYGAQVGFLKLEDGEPKVLRMLTAFSPAYIVSHGCGMQHVDIPKAEFDDAIQRSGQFMCPNCGQPLTMDDIECERPQVEGAYMHRFIQTSEANKRANFVCCGHPQNSQWDIIEKNEAGAPRYECPICANTDNKGEHPKPVLRLYGVAVEREVQIEVQNRNGIPTPIAVGTTDVVEAGEDGIMRPKLVIVDLPVMSFWNPLYEMVMGKNKQYSTSICYFDVQVTRTGSGLDTRYMVNILNQEPNAIDFAPYKDMMPDVKGMLRAWGKPKYYNDRGWAVQGYTPEGTASQGTAAANTLFAELTEQPQPQSAATTSWSQISNAIGQ